MKKLILVLVALILTFTGCEKEEIAAEDPKIPLEEKYSNEWTIEMTVSDVTPTGLKGKITHSGDNVNAITGSRFVLEKLVDGEWTEADALCEPAWYLLAYPIPNNDSYEFDVNWEWLYGTLLSGHYRIVKDVRIEGTRLNEYQGIKRIEHFIEEKILYAEFDI
ncbi:MAG: hypothetical protein IJ323_04945 [Clostridia bacterium]|nr:hypothetical protein [Clostridia bacterium]MBQ7897754.1 hypothetical protein [Clostridia bacterium]